MSKWATVHLTRKTWLKQTSETNNNNKKQTKNFVQNWISIFGIFGYFTSPIMFRNSHSIQLYQPKKKRNKKKPISLNCNATVACFCCGYHFLVVSLILISFNQNDERVLYFKKNTSFFSHCLFSHYVSLPRVFFLFFSFLITVRHFCF